MLSPDWPGDIWVVWGVKKSRILDFPYDNYTQTFNGIVILHVVAVTLRYDYIKKGCLARQ